MGRAKEEWLETQERGWDAPEKHVCSKCVDVEFLVDVIDAAVSANTCDYCNQTSDGPIAAPISVLVERVADTVGYYYEEPTAAGVPYDGGFILEPESIFDVLDALGLDCGNPVFEDVAHAFTNDYWVPAAQGHWASSHEHEILQDSWNSFVWVVKHETRFHFMARPNRPSAGPQEIEPGRILGAIGRVVGTLGLVTSFEGGVALYRVRVRAPSDTWLPDSSELSAPPNRRARAGRMNPAGISYLYCALEMSTAIAETVSAPPQHIVVGTFKTARPLTVLNLCKLPPLPSIFDSERRADREWIVFLERFVKSISEPVRKDGSEHIDYVPSQIVCEWFAQVYEPDGKGTKLDGVIYPSAVLPGGKNLVLFPSERSYEYEFDSVIFENAEETDVSTWSDLTTALVS